MNEWLEDAMRDERQISLFDEARGPVNDPEAFQFSLTSGQDLDSFSTPLDELR